MTTFSAEGVAEPNQRLPADGPSALGLSARIGLFNDAD